MARPVDPRSRSAAARLIDVPEATLRSLESRKVLEPVSDWGITDLVWARVAATAGVDAASLPPVPKRIESRSWLLLPHGAGRSSVIGTLDQVREALDDLSINDPADYGICLPIGAWAKAIGDQWA